MRDKDRRPSKRYKMSEEHKKHLSENHRDCSGEKNPMYGIAPPHKGKHLPKKWKTNISLGNIGKLKSEEHKRNMKKPKTEEHKQKLRKPKTEKGRKNIILRQNWKDNFNPIVGKYEKQILDTLEKVLTFPIKRQYPINGYWLDGYCEKLNLAIEIDEKWHYKKNILNKKDLKKQKSIIKSLNCVFLRLRVNEILSDKGEVKCYLM